MKTVVVTDGRYRASLAAVRSIGEAGFDVVVTQTSEDASNTCASFLSKYTKKTHRIEGSVSDQKYPERLLTLLREYDHPVLFCTGAATLGAVSRERERFREVCDFIVSSEEVLANVNDKQRVHEEALAIGIPVPRQYSEAEAQFPVIVKPRCGEKLGLKAKDRYAAAESKDELKQILLKMRRLDPSPVIQEKVTGEAEGANLLIGKDGELVAAMCHRRIRELPVSGGPSTCCVSFYNEKLIADSYRLLRKMNFTGLAMAEYKGGKLLEINPRVWGSFPLTQLSGPPMAALYARAAAGEKIPYIPKNYRQGVKMRFIFNDGLAALEYLFHGRFFTAARAAADFFRVKEALFRWDDIKASAYYIKNSLGKR